MTNQLQTINTKKLKSIVAQLGETKSILTETELLATGASKTQIDELVSLGVLYPSAQGIYMPENADFGERHSEVEVATRFPNAVICLTNALNFYQVTTQRASKVWIAYPEGTPEPIEPKLPIKTISMSELRFSQGIEIYQIEGLPVKIYNLAKTIADCFIYQDEVGTDVAIEAFLQAIEEKLCTVSSILSYIDNRQINSYAQQDLIECIQQAEKIINGQKYSSIS
ncbi:MAG: type IV toxin-antitoxin system AbiEi family antitoxin domain-containing protein [Waterburya sp.]